MRIYFDDKKKELVSVICNSCKKEIRVEIGRASCRERVSASV